MRERFRAEVARLGAFWSTVMVVIAGLVVAGLIANGIALYVAHTAEQDATDRAAVVACQAVVHNRAELRRLLADVGIVVASPQATADVNILIQRFLPAEHCNGSTLITNR